MENALPRVRWLRIHDLVLISSNLSIFENRTWPNLLLYFRRTINGIPDPICRACFCGTNMQYLKPYMIKPVAVFHWTIIIIQGDPSTSLANSWSEWLDICCFHRVCRSIVSTLKYDLEICSGIRCKLQHHLCTNSTDRCSPRKETYTTIYTEKLSKHLTDAPRANVSNSA